MFGKIIQDLGANVGLSRSADTEPPERVRALRANRFGADLVVSFAMPKDGDEPAVYYFESKHSRSHAGQLMAKAVAEELHISSSGRATPMLKNTRSPAIVIAAEDLGERVGGKAAQGIINLFADPGE
jgi:N-acetylmuramoyl-L-alanine amidase